MVHYNTRRKNNCNLPKKLLKRQRGGTRVCGDKCKKKIENTEITCTLKRKVLDPSNNVTNIDTSTFVIKPGENAITTIKSMANEGGGGHKKKIKRRKPRKKTRKPRKKTRKPRKKTRKNL
tara:strand:+ start:2413 stop:2772 length:360 start_codon:yes stop_codon:yes gene_type:complete